MRDKGSKTPELNSEAFKIEKLKPTPLALKCLKNNLEYERKNGEGRRNYHKAVRKITNQFNITRTYARVVKSADTAALKAAGEIREGSSPSPRTKV